MNRKDCLTKAGKILNRTNNYGSETRKNLAKEAEVWIRLAEALGEDELDV